MFLAQNTKTIAWIHQNALLTFLKSSHGRTPDILRRGGGGQGAGDGGIPLSFHRTQHLHTRAWSALLFSSPYIHPQSKKGLRGNYPAGDHATLCSFLPRLLLTMRPLFLHASSLAVPRFFYGTTFLLSRHHTNTANSSPTPPLPPPPHASAHKRLFTHFHVRKQVHAALPSPSLALPLSPVSHPFERRRRRVVHAEAEQARPLVARDTREVPRAAQAVVLEAVSLVPIHLPGDGLGL